MDTGEKQQLMDARTFVIEVSSQLSDAQHSCKDKERAASLFAVQQATWRVLDQINALINEMPLDEPLATLLAQYNAVQAERRILKEQPRTERVRELEMQATDLREEIEKTHTLSYYANEQIFKVTIGPLSSVEINGAYLPVSDGICGAWIQSWPRMS